MKRRYGRFYLLTVFFLIVATIISGNYAKITAGTMGNVNTSVVLLYFNGDNNLNSEVLHALDMIETIGSSENLHILVLYDGHKDYVGGYGPEWAGSRLIYVTRDDEIGKIRSIVLEDYGEKDLGKPEALEAFIRKGRKIDADRYMFGIFSHGRGIIDTDRLTGSGPHKSLAISVDETNASLLSLPQFRDAIHRSMDGRKFEIMVFFTCLTNMVEIGYELKDVTRFIVGSEDEIRIVNLPPGRFQIRGIKFEDFLKTIRDNPAVSAEDVGERIVDAYIEQYGTDLMLPNMDDGFRSYRYAASLSMTDCDALDLLAQELNSLAVYMMGKLEVDPKNQHYIDGVRRAQSRSQRYPSFLDLEYYDLIDFLRHLAHETSDSELTRICRRILEILRDRVLVYEKHTDDVQSNGLSIYISHTAVPDNIFRAHQQMYRQSRFSMDTQWDEMIEMMRSAHKTRRVVDDAMGILSPASH